MIRDWINESHWLQDRFTICLLLATALHATVVLGVHFGVSLKPSPRLADTLDVVLVKWRSEDEPEDVDFLAQATQQGGGESTEKSRPSQPESGNLPIPEQGGDPVQSQQETPQAAEELREVLAVESDVADPLETTDVAQPENEQPSAAKLMRQSMNMAALQPQLSSERKSPSKLPRREYISANTREYEFASYMSAWVAKVERVGNMNYPHELRHRKLHGDLVMTVGVDQKGSVESIDIMRSSGIPEIDRAAVQIVRLAAPYAPLPDNISDRVDILHITRTWRFESRFGAE
jgi:protein TonB